MKRTISLAALAISASTSSMALMMPGMPHTTYETKTYCLAIYDGEGGMMASSCDESRNNVSRGLQIGENGCAANQISLSTSKKTGDAEFPIKIRSCVPINAAQL